MKTTDFTWRLIWSRMLLAAGLGCLPTLALAQDSTPAFNDTDLVVGVSYVIPPFVGGAKVRTPESIETALAAEIATRLRADLRTVSAVAADRSALLKNIGMDFLVGTPRELQVSYPDTIIVPTGYFLSPMAIMRADSDIKTWAQLQGRTVCLSEGGPYRGTMAAQYGAVEKVLRAPADSLLALRTGVCDAAVHDSSMLNELLKLPEWKKFSARLPSGQRVPLVFAVSSDKVQTVKLLKQASSDWKASRYLDKLTKNRARDIAFEVYLDQNVPDCH